MLEKPALEDEKIIACLRDQYGLLAAEVVFLPLGADVNTAVYRVDTEDRTPYFLKLRSGVFDELSVALPDFFHTQGIAQIIDPIATRSGRLWGKLDAFAVILYPFVEGHNGFEVSLTDAQWIEFGAAIKRVHSVSAPPTLISRLQRERFSPEWRELVKGFQARAAQETFADPVSAKLAALLQEQRSVIDDLVARAERLAQALQSRSLEWVICHTDIHLGNLLLTASGALYIVDWDAPILAPKERDLMFIGAGVGKPSSEKEDALFYQGYGDTEIDFAALAYYRYERIVQDIASYSEQILLSLREGRDREDGLYRLSGAFPPNGVIDIAFRADRTR